MISLYKSAKDTLAVAESNLCSGEIPQAWQEHLSETIAKINIGKKKVDMAEELHRQKSAEYQQAERVLQGLEKDLKKNIIRSQFVFLADSQCCH